MIPFLLPFLFSFSFSLPFLSFTLGTPLPTSSVFLSVLLMSSTVWSVDIVPGGATAQRSLSSPAQLARIFRTPLLCHLTMPLVYSLL